MEDLNKILSTYEPITLGEMDSVALLNRVDTKYLIDKATLYSILEEVQGDYRVLEIDNRRFNSYETIYYDTPQLDFYTLHHRGKVNRYKFRQRSYIESDLNFMEIKFKNNKKRTIKNRVIIDGIDMELDAENLDYIQKISKMDLDLEATLVNTFTRITLVGKEFPERMTIDLNLSFDANEKQLELEKTVIIEAKQEKINRKSPFLKALKKRYQRTTRISKYCFGMALTNEDLKQNNFKQRIKKITQIENGNVA